MSFRTEVEREQPTGAEVKERVSRAATAAEIESEIQRIHLLVPFILAARTDWLLEHIQMHDTIGPLFDPTKWMKMQKNVDRNRSIISAIDKAQRSLIRDLGKAECELLAGSLHLGDPESVSEARNGDDEGPYLKERAGA